MIATNPTSPLKKTLLYGGAFVACIVMWQWVLALARLDPFASFRNPSSGPFGGGIGLRMENVSIKHYSRGDLVGTCTVGRIDLHKNRQVADLYLVRNGTYTSKNGEFKYESDRAQYDSGNQRLNVLSGAKIRNKDMDIVADAFEYNQKTNLLYVPGSIKGKLFDGKVTGKSLTYSLKDNSYRLGPVNWVGTVTLSEQETGDKPITKKDMDFKAKRSYSKDDIVYMEEAKAQDGEVILLASKIEQDRKTDIVTATGKVRYFSAKTNMTCDKVIVYRKEKRAVLTGNVQMVLKPKELQRVEAVEIAPYQPVVPEEISKTRPPAPPGKSDRQKELDDEVRSGKTLRKYPITILATNIEYWYGKGNRHAIMSGSPQALQDLQEGRWRYVWTNKMFYDGENEKMRLESTPGTTDTLLKNSRGDIVNAKWISFSTVEETNDFEGEDTSGTFATDDEEVLPKIGGDGKKVDDKKGGTQTGGDKKTDDKKGDDKKGGGTGIPPSLKGWIKPSVKR